jgi:hypothetical protein
VPIRITMREEDMTHSRLVAPWARRAAAAAVVLFMTGPALAGDVFYDVTLGLRIGDDSRFFLNLTNQHYAPPPDMAVAVVKRCPRPADDYPVILFLSSASRRPADAILAMRLRGLSWTDILIDLRLSPAVLFAGLDRDPGPPYGNAWGHWKHHKRQPKKARFVLSDAQVVDLVKLQVAASYYRVNPYAIVGERQRGVSVERYSVVKGRPAGAAPAKSKGSASKGARPERGQGQPRGQGQSPKNR